MFVGDIPVDTGKQLFIAFVCREIGERSCFVSIFTSYKIRKRFWRSFSVVREIKLSGSATPSVEALQRLATVGVSSFSAFIKKNNLFFDNRSTSRETV